MATDDATIRIELEGFITASGTNPDAQMTQVRSQMDLYFVHGQWACTNDLPQKAVDSFERCLKIDPNAAIIHCALSRIHLTRGDLAKAEKHARRALELQPNDFKNLLTCRLIVAKRGRDASVESQLLQNIRFRIAAVARSLGLAAPVWPWDPNATADAWRVESLRKAAADFRTWKYAVLRGVMPAGWVELLNAEHTALRTGGGHNYQAEMYRYVKVDLPMTSVANYEIAGLVARILGKEVIPTYTFAIHYLPKGHIKPHRDRPQNELSMSLSLAATPGGKDVSVLHAGQPDSMARVDLGPNDALLYRGTEVTHARDAVPEGHTVDQAIFGFRTVNKSHCYCI
jgi:tetratricopeptide (TPR) repeat protein